MSHKSRYPHMELRYVVRAHACACARSCSHACPRVSVCVRMCSRVSGTTN